MELQGHQPILEKVVQQGERLANAGHFARPNIKKRCADLNDAWHTLLENSMIRRRKLDLALQKQQVDRLGVNGDSGLVVRGVFIFIFVNIIKIASISLM